MRCSSVSGDPTRRRWYRSAVIATITLALLMLPDPGSDEAKAAHTPLVVEPDFELVPILDRMYFPVAARYAPDGRIFVIDKTGLVYGYDSAEDTDTRVIVNLAERVNAHQERGMFGLEVDPAFPARPYLYVFYTTEPPGCPTPDGACVVNARISRIEVTSDNRLQGTEQVLLEGYWCQEASRHANAALAFGPEGALYASAGDGAPTQTDWGQRGNGCGDPAREGGSLRAQDLRTGSDPIGYSGGIIRIDPETGGPWPNNPGTGTIDDRRLIAYGFRNPWRFAIHPDTGALYVADVGLHTYEEINVVPEPTASVGNYGWPCYEGPSRQPAFSAAGLPLCQSLYASPGAARAPFFSYGHFAKPDPDRCGAGHSAVSAVGIYESGAYPAFYDGGLFFADYVAACLWVMLLGADGTPDPGTIRTIATGAPVIDIQPGPNGDLLIVIGEWNFPRRLYRLRHVKEPTAVIAASRTFGPSPVEVTFDASGSVSPDGQPLNFAWDLDGDGGFDDATGPQAAASYTATTTEVGLLATHPTGARSVATIVVYGHDRPTAVIISPPPGPYRVGDSIIFEGSGHDLEDGELAPDALTWQVVLRDCDPGCTERILAEFPGVRSGSFVVADHRWPASVQLRLLAADSGGLSHTVGAGLAPQTAKLEFATDPPGLTLVVDDRPERTPFPRTAIVGSSIPVSAPSPQHLAGSGHRFGSWSDAGAQQHDIVAAEDSARYTAVMPAGGIPAAAVGLVDPDTGIWHLQTEAGDVHSFFYGNPGDKPFVGDWDCDGDATPGLHRQSDGFVYLRDSNTQGIADIRFFFGNPGDVPVPGDFNGDGCDTVSLYRPSATRVFVINQLGSDEQGLGAADFSYVFGNPGDAPFVGDFDGNGIDEVGLYRAETGMVYFRLSLTSGIADSSFFYGNAADRIVTGDWTGQGRDTLGVFRPADTTFYFRHTNTAGFADAELQWGDASWLPVAGVFGLG